MVGAVQDFMGRQALLCDAPEQGFRHGHKEGGGNALVRYIPDQETETVGIYGEEIVQIPTDFLGGD